MQLVQQTSGLERSENLILLGASGVGKTHLAAGVEQMAIQLGKRVKFFSATTLASAVTVR